MQPLVSVKVPAYKHEPYIAQCLEGILMQRTDFPYEVIVGDDASPDGTRAVAERYRDLAPDRVTVLPPEPNLGPGRNVLRLQRACRGKYQAVCEGDDYWIDPRKLQRQVDLMEAHPDIPMCFHNAFFVRPGRASVHLFFGPSLGLGERISFAAACDLNLPTASVMVRSRVQETLPEWRREFICGDLFFRLWCAHQGSLGYIDEIMSVYRQHAGGIIAMTAERKLHEDAIRIYQRFDQETGGVHADLLLTQIKRQKASMRRGRWGRAYFLWHPRLFLKSLKRKLDRHV